MHATRAAPQEGQPPSPTPTGRAGSASLTAALVEICTRETAPRDLDRASTLLRDWVGVAVAGAMTREGRAVRAPMQAAGDPDAKPVALGLGRRDAMTAAYVNGAYGTLLEMDDLHRASILHAGDVVIPAALSAAQEAGCSGERLLGAIIRGYEVALRIGMAAAGGGYTAWYNSGTCGVFGAAMAAAEAMDLSTEQRCDALGHAGMQAAGLWQCRLEPCDAKCLATAHAARAGVTAARMAAAGLRGPRAILEGELGLLATLYAGADAAPITAPQDGWALHGVSLKPWPACRHVHPAIGAALDLCARQDPDEIRGITVHSYAAGLAFCDNPHPSTPQEARFSFQHMVAVACLRGAPGLRDADPDALADPALRALRNRITLAEDPGLTAAFPARMGARIELLLADGTRRAIATDHAPGDPEDPLPDAALDAKLRTNLAAAGAGPDIAAELDAALSALPTARNPDALTLCLDRLSDAIARTAKDQTP